MPRALLPEHRLELRTDIVLVGGARAAGREHTSQRTLNRHAATMDNVCINLCRAQIGVAKLLLHGADIHASQQEMCRKGMTQ